MVNVTIPKDALDRSFDRLGANIKISNGEISEHFGFLKPEERRLLYDKYSDDYEAFGYKKPHFIEL